MTPVWFLLVAASVVWVTLPFLRALAGLVAVSALVLLIAAAVNPGWASEVNRMSTRVLGLGQTVLEWGANATSRMTGPPVRGAMPRTWCALGVARVQDLTRQDPIPRGALRLSAPASATPAPAITSRAASA